MYYLNFMLTLFPWSVPCNEIQHDYCNYELHLFFTLQVTSLLNRMQLHAEQSGSGDNECNINVLIPPTRSDVLHPCDVMEVVMAIVTTVLPSLLPSQLDISHVLLMPKCIFSFQGRCNCLWVQ